MADRFFEYGTWPARDQCNGVVWILSGNSTARLGPGLPHPGARRCLLRLGGLPLLPHDGQRPALGRTCRPRTTVTAFLVPLAVMVIFPMCVPRYGPTALGIAHFVFVMHSGQFVRSKSPDSRNSFACLSWLIIPPSSLASGLLKPKTDFLFYVSKSHVLLPSTCWTVGVNPPPPQFPPVMGPIWPRLMRQGCA